MQNKLWQYKQTMDLVQGDSVIVLNDGRLEEVAIQSITKKTGNKVRFCRLNVEEIDNYFAGTICVHNSESSKDQSCNPTDGDDFRARELAKSCGGDPAKPAGCRTTQADVNKAQAEQQKLCNEFDGNDCDGIFGGIVRGKVKEKIKTEFPNCPLSDADVDKMVNAMCGAAKNCPPPPPPPPDSCISEDTLIHTPQGLRVVKDLKAGDVVISYDIKSMIDSSDPSWSLWSSETLEGNTATSVVVYNKNSYWHSWFEILLSNDTKLNITYEHPVLVRSEGSPALLSFN
jgi:hypothetical protein